MVMASPCPPVDRLRQLVVGELSAEDQVGLVSHLDHCVSCQERLEVVAGGGAMLSSVALAVGRAPHAREASLIRLLNDLKTDPHVTQVHRPQPTTEWMKSLLKPVESLNLLGKLETYEVVEMLGQGGMGIVLKAFEPALRRTVAIKVLAPHLASDEMSRKRFAREAQAAAAVRHENVVTIHAVSEANGLPYIVMEYVDGGSLQDYLNQRGPLDWRTTIRVGMQLASGLAAAHAQGLIHRDIKPSNILLQSRAEETGTNDGENGKTIDAGRVTFPVPKITDFGLARIADETRLTQTGIVAGTPMYMSPEQALADPLDARADLFSLGSVLYVLCTGREPFSAVTPMAVLHRVCETQPQPIPELNPDIPPWLVNVIERLHAKKPEHRFANALEVAELFRSYLAHLEQPETFPVPRLSATHKPVPKPKPGRRALAIFLALAIGLAASELAGWTHLGKAVSSWSRRHPEPAAPVSQLATLEGHKGPIWSVDFAPDGRTVATAGDDGTIRLWDLQGRETAKLTGHLSTVYAVRFARTGDWLVSGSDDGTAKIWDIKNQAVEASLPHHAGGVRSVAISPDVQTVAVGGTDHTIELWNVSSRKVQQTITDHQSTVSALAFSPDSQTLASGDTGGHAKLWDRDSGKKQRGFQADTLRVRTLEFAPDGKMLMTVGTGDRSAKLWRPDTGELLATFPGHVRGISTAALASDGRRLAVGSRDGSIKFWDMETQRPLGAFHAHQGNVWSIAFSPDGRNLVSVGEDRVGKLWDVSAVQP